MAHGDPHRPADAHPGDPAPEQSPERDESAPEITSSEPDSFPHGVFTQRHPALLRQVADALPHPPAHRAALRELAAQMDAGVMQPLDDTAHDKATWDAWGAEHFGKPWLQAPFLWAESYFYRRLLGAVRYHSPGPWQGVDPFAPMKREELDGPTVDAQCAALEELVAGTPSAAKRSNALLRGAVWGNQADLSFRLSAAQGPGGAPQGADLTGEGTPRLVADDSDALWSLLDERPPGVLCLVADNAGSELVSDLLWVDDLLESGRITRAALHVKPVPYYVSDATTADVLLALRRLGRATGAAGEAGRRLWAASRDGRLVLRTHPFYCAPFPYTRLPTDLRAEFAGATLTVVKGDLNYRRLVEDRRWPATSPFAERVGYFPGPVAALRILKSDVVVGLEAAVRAELDASGERWRTSGTHALIQCHAAAGQTPGGRR